jgi:hypothetical protein
MREMLAHLLIFFKGNIGFEVSTAHVEEYVKGA